MIDTTIPTLAALEGPSNWWELQDQHQNMHRWESYTSVNKALPLQSNAAHIHGLSWLAQDHLPRLAAHPQAPEFDQGRIMSLIWIHDDPEARLRRDVQYHDKTSLDDVDELRAFFSLVQGHPARIKMIDTFMIQFLTKGKLGVFEKYLEPGTIERLKKDYWMEAMLFNALERRDYIQYALLCYKMCRDVVIMTHVLRNQAQALKEYGRRIPGFRDVFWTLEQIQLAEDFMEYFKHMPESKGPGGGIPAAYEWAYANGHMERPIEIGVVIDKSLAFGEDPRGCS